jgi:hypothetical protein
MVRSWLSGALLPPKGYFFRVIDILDEAEPDWPTLQDKPKDESPRKPERDAASSLRKPTDNEGGA